MSNDYQQKEGKINVFTNNRERDAATGELTSKGQVQPLLTGDMTLDLQEYYKNGDVEVVTEDGVEKHIVKLRCALWAKTSEKTGTKYWQGNVQVAKKKQASHDELPPMGGEEPAQAPAEGETKSELPF